MDTNTQHPQHTDSHSHTHDLNLLYGQEELEYYQKYYYAQITTDYCLMENQKK